MTGHAEHAVMEIKVQPGFCTGCRSQPRAVPKLRQNSTENRASNAGNTARKRNPLTLSLAS